MEQNRVNFHTHCNRCRHAAGTAKEYAQAAAEQKLAKLGFSDHLPFPDDRFGMRMPYAELEEYLDEIAELQAAFAMEIFCGFEGEYVRGEDAYYERLLSDARCDYLILGQHYFPDSRGETVNIYSEKSTERYELYSHSIVDAMRTGFFRYAAHPDLFLINCSAWDIHCDRACDILVDGAVKYGFALEYNANGLRRGKQEYADGERYPYPHRKLWEHVKGSGIRVYVGSDCHSPEQVYDTYVQTSYQTLAGMGIIAETDWK